MMGRMSLLFSCVLSTEKSQVGAFLWEMIIFCQLSKGSGGFEMSSLIAEGLNLEPDNLTFSWKLEDKQEIDSDTQDWGWGRQKNPGTRE